MSINGERVVSASLHDGDVLDVCGQRIVFNDADQRGSPVRSGEIMLADEDYTGEVTTIGGPSRVISVPAQRLQMIYQISSRLTALRDFNELLNDAMDICVEMLGFERGAIAVRPQGQRGVDWPVIRNIKGAEGEIALSHTILGRALDHGERCIVNDGDELISKTESINRLGIRSAMCVPMLLGNEILGVIYGDRTSLGTTYAAEDADFLFALAGQLAIGLANCRLMQEQRRKIILEGQIGLASEIQQVLFPRRLPDDEKIKVAAYNSPGQSVSGDYFDVIELGNGCLGIIIADVTGKGVAAALLMANLQGTVRATLADIGEPAKAMRTWNRLICQNTDAGNFITCQLAIWDTESRTMSISVGGHPPPYLLTDDGASCRMLKLQNSTPLGVDLEAEFYTTPIELGASPCSLYFYSDGVNEAKASSREDFGDERLADTLKACGSLNPDAMIDAVQGAITEFTGDEPQSDDITMVAVHIK